MPTFPRGFANHRIHVRNAKQLEQLARETGGHVTQERQRYTSTPEDAAVLRCIPVIGPVTGVIPGTHPESVIYRNS